MIFPKALTQWISSSRTVDALFQFYLPDIKAAFVSGKTGFPLPLPKKTVNKAQLLNLLLFQPEMGLVWGDRIAFTQLDIYRPYLKRTKKKFAIFATSLKGKTPAELQVPGVPCFTFTNGFDPMLYLAGVPSLDALLYVSHKSDNYAWISAQKHLVHAYSGHGYSEKHTAEFRLATAYDFIMRTDMESTLRFVKNGIQLPPDRFLLVGGSPIEGLEFVPEKTPITNVLYAPTWEGYGNDVNFSSVMEVGQRMQDFAKEGGKLLVRLHPGLGKKDPEFKETGKKIAAATQMEPMPKVDALNWSDAIVADISGIIPEYLFSGKPIIVPIPKKSWKAAYLKRTNLKSFCYIWNPDAMSLAEFLQNIADDPMREKRLNRRKQLYLGSETVEELCQHFENALNYLSHVRQQRRLQNFTNFQHEQKLKNLFQKLPEDPALRDAVLAVREGRAFFHMSE